MIGKGGGISKHYSALVLCSASRCSRSSSSLCFPLVQTNPTTTAPMLTWMTKTTRMELDMYWHNTLGKKRLFRKLCWLETLCCFIVNTRTSFTFTPCLNNPNTNGESATHSILLSSRSPWCKQVVCHLSRFGKHFFYGTLGFLFFNTQQVSCPNWPMYRMHATRQTVYVWSKVATLVNNHEILLKGVFGRLWLPEDYLFVAVCLLHCCAVCSLFQHVSRLWKLLASTRTMQRWRSKRYNTRLVWWIKKWVRKWMDVQLGCLQDILHFYTCRSLLWPWRFDTSRGHVSGWRRKRINEDWITW